MDIEAELRHRLAEPSPLLLPWLARRVDERDLRVVAYVAAFHRVFAPGRSWPAVADAVAAAVAQRLDVVDLDLVHRLLRVLPPVAAHLSPEVRRGVSFDTVPEEARVYSALGAQLDRHDDGSFGAPPTAHRGAWEVLRAARERRPLRPSAEMAAYLLPLLDPVPPGWRQLAAQAVATWGAAPRMPTWYSRVVAVRITPFLDAAGVRVVAASGVSDAYRLRRVVGDQPAARTAEQELAAAHGGLERLSALAARIDAGRLAEICLEAALAIRDTVPLDDGLRSGAVDYVESAVPSNFEQLQPGLDEDRARHVNVFVAPAGGLPDPSRPLPADTALEVLCSVGRLDPTGLLAATDPVFPDRFLPATALDLTVVLTVGSTVRSTALRLPARGSSAVVRLPLDGAARDAVVTADLALYYEVALVYLVELVVPVEGAGGVPAATVTYCLDTALTDLRPVADRSMSVTMTASADARFLVNGTEFGARLLLGEANRVDAAVRAVRTQLYDAHFRIVDGREVSRFDAAQRKSTAELTGDLARLAYCGRNVYRAVFDDPVLASRLPEFLRTEARARRRPPVIQVVDPTGRNTPVPWAAVYDLPVGSDSTRYEPCPSLRELGAGVGELPVCCPYEHTHRQPDGRWKPDQLCPWGFWGFSALLEHPPRVSGRALARVVGTGDRRVFLAADGPDLDDQGRRGHMTALRESLRDELDYRDRPSADALGAALAGEVDVVYLFCHSGRTALARDTPPDPYLLFDRRITPTDIDQWKETSWPLDHWAQRRPLVVINGCHTVETVSGSLSDFVMAFTTWAGGAGVVGTEITIEQGVAARAMELFLDRLRTRAVGDALRATRWEMLRRGNVMGLAYTPYCLATLVLRDRNGAA